MDNVPRIIKYEIWFRLYDSLKKRNLKMKNIMFLYIKINNKKITKFSAREEYVLNC